MSCNGDCFNCKYDDCIITDSELRKQMREKREKKKTEEEKKIKTKKRKVTPFRIGVPKGELKAEYILTPLPHSPESQRTWSVNEDESTI